MIKLYFSVVIFLILFPSILKLSSGTLKAQNFTFYIVPKSLMGCFLTYFSCSDWANYINLFSRLFILISAVLFTHTLRFKFFQFPNFHLIVFCIFCFFDETAWFHPRKVKMAHLSILMFCNIIILCIIHTITNEKKNLSKEEVIKNCS
jgi:hypothetical protein